MEVRLKFDGVETLYSCRGGSQEWGYATPESDLDVYFLFKSDPRKYLGLETPKETIVFSKDGVEYSGWDIRKAAFLAAKSNPGLLEQLCSTQVYLEKAPFMDEFRNLALAMYEPAAAWWHYRSIAHNQWEKYLVTKEYPLKKWWSFYRGVMMARYAGDNDDLPPMDILDLAQVLDLRGKLFHFVRFASVGELNNYDKGWLQAWSEGAYNSLMESEPPPKRMKQAEHKDLKNALSELVVNELLS